MIPFGEGFTRHQLRHQVRSYKLINVKKHGEKSMMNFNTQNHSLGKALDNMGTLTASRKCCLDGKWDSFWKLRMGQLTHTSDLPVGAARLE